MNLNITFAEGPEQDADQEPVAASEEAGKEALIAYFKSAYDQKHIEEVHAWAFNDVVTHYLETMSKQYGE